MTGFQGYDQWKTASPYDDYDDTPEFERDTDPYGHLTYAIGTADDFICFDYVVSKCGQFVMLHSVVNSETGSFIQDFTKPDIVEAHEAKDEAQALVNMAIDWCIDNEIKHDESGWNQDTSKFAADVMADTQT